MPDFFAMGYTNILIVDKPYPPEKMAEARAVNWAVLSGACDKCGALAQCSTDTNFKPSIFAPCMVKKAEFLKEADSHA